MDEITFRKYTSEDASLFKSLNIEWLEKYFVVEPIDELVLSNPQTEILDKGGFILMAEFNKKVIGTFAFIKKEELLYEFSKMAIQFAISFAEQHHWKKIILYSNTLLENSIHLYRKYGFIEVPIEEQVVYSRGNIKMELNLN